MKRVRVRAGRSYEREVVYWSKWGNLFGVTCAYKCLPMADQRTEITYLYHVSCHDARCSDLPCQKCQILVHGTHEEIRVVERYLSVHRIRLRRRPTTSWWCISTIYDRRCGRRKRTCMVGGRMIRRRGGLHVYTSMESMEDACSELRFVQHGSWKKKTKVSVMIWTCIEYKHWQTE